MNTPTDAVLFDFAPHAVEHVGSFGERWFVSLVEHPLLLALDGAGKVVGRFAIPDVETVVGGKIAVRRRVPRARPANVQRETDYDDRGLATRVHGWIADDADEGAWVVEHDAAGRVLTRTRGDGVKETYTYAGDCPTDVYALLDQPNSANE